MCMYCACASDAVCCASRTDACVGLPTFLPARLTCHSTDRPASLDVDAVAADVDADVHVELAVPAPAVEPDIEADVLREIASGRDSALHFRVIRMMGRGGFGYVFKVRRAL
jgi:hypothetical protein